MTLYEGTHPMPEIKMPAANITETVFRLFVSGNSLQDAVNTAAAHVKNASADYCASHGIELNNLTINLQSALAEKNGYRLTYAIAHKATCKMPTTGN